jgi:hypothetical protein
LTVLNGVDDTGVIGVRCSLATFGGAPALPLFDGGEEPVLIGSPGELFSGGANGLVARVGWLRGSIMELLDCDGSWAPCHTKMAVSTIITTVAQNKGTADQSCFGGNALLLCWSSISSWF